MGHDPYQALIIASGRSGIGDDYWEKSNRRHALASDVFPVTQFTNDVEKVYFDHTCHRCKKAFKSKTNRARYCIPCLKEINKEHARENEKLRYWARRRELGLAGPDSYGGPADPRFAAKQECQDAVQSENADDPHERRGSNVDAGDRPHGANGA